MSCRFSRTLMASCILILASIRASAFDPFTVVTVIGTAADVAGSASQIAGEVSESADAFGELYGEIDSDAVISDDGNQLILELREIEAMASEAGYTKEEVEQLTADSAHAKDAKKLSSTIRAVTRAVRTGKRVARLIMPLDQKAKLSEVESAQIEREQLVVLYRQLRSEHERELREIKERLKEEKDKRDQIKTLKTEEKRSGAKVFGNTGVLSFPKQTLVIEEAIRMAVQMRPGLFSLLLLIFLIRVSFYQFSFFGTAQYDDLIRDTIVCALLLWIFPDLVRACISITNDLAGTVGLKELQNIEPGKIDFPAEMGLWIKTRLLLEWLFQWIKYLAFVTAHFLANFGLAFLILLFPIIIFCSQMLNFSIAWPIFLGSFISVCLWPLFWNATGVLAVLLWRKEDASLSDQIATILFAILQFLSPLVGVACLKGQPVSKAIRSAGHSVSGAVSGGASTVMREITGFVRGTKGVRGGGQVGRILSYPVNQAAGRLVAAHGHGSEAARATEEHNRNIRWSQELNPVWREVAKAAASGFVNRGLKRRRLGGRNV